MKEKGNNTLADLVIEANSQTRMTYQIARQLEAHLPIKSFAALAKALPEVSVDGNELSLKIFAPHVNENLFPIENSQDLVSKLSIGIRQALSMANSGFPIRNVAVRQILATTFSREPEKRYATPIAYAKPSMSTTK